MNLKSITSDKSFNTLFYIISNNITILLKNIIFSKIYLMNGLMQSFSYNVSLNLNNITV